MKRWDEMIFMKVYFFFTISIVNPVQGDCYHGECIIVSKELQELSIQTQDLVGQRSQKFPLADL